jgi:Tfp pilus assembly protein PilF
VPDFRKAVDLGDPTYFPYYYLAHDALSRDDCQKAISWCEEALHRGGASPRIESELYGWMAICHSDLGMTVEVIDKLFQKAIEIDPENEVVRGNYQLFLASPGSRPSQTKIQWRRERARAETVQFVYSQSALMQVDRAGFVGRALEPISA